MLLVSMAWAYFYFNDYIVPWYGGDVWDKLLQEYTEKGPLGYLWYTMLICEYCRALGNSLESESGVRRLVFAIVGILSMLACTLSVTSLSVGVTINRMPFTWRQYEPRIEIPMTIGTFALFLVIYASLPALFLCSRFGKCRKVRKLT